MALQAVHWAVPWASGEVWNTVFLAAATLVVVAVPVVYGMKANLRDPLARALLAGTSVTGLAFLITLVATIAFHYGWKPDDSTFNWITRVTYAAVAIGKATLLIALLRVISVSRNRKDKGSQ